MRLAYALLAFLSAPFWATQSLREWSDKQLEQFLTDSPWCRPLRDSDARACLATAQPVREAEAEKARRARAKDPNAPPPEPDYEYLDFLRADQGAHLVLAIYYTNQAALSDAREARAMEETSLMRIGKQKFKMDGHFPPTPSDPYLRLVYPRAPTAKDKTVTFDLYLPGITQPYRTLEFWIKDMVYKGKLEM